MTFRWKIAQWFELHWWQNYLRGKDKTAYLAWKKNYWQTLLSIIADDVKLNSSNSIVDLGCGPAGIFIAFSQNKVTAVDPLLNEYEKHTQFFSQNDYPNVNFVKSTIEDFDAGSLTYDLVFCMNAINHVHDIEKGFEQLKKLCANNSTIIVSIDAHNFSFFKYLFRLVPGDILHPHQYDLDEYKSMLAKDGWTISTPALLKHEFFFDHYVLVAKKGKSRQSISTK
jgi:SAM-dependent methyltransferase